MLDGESREVENWHEDAEHDEAGASEYNEVGGFGKGGKQEELAGSWGEASTDGKAAGDEDANLRG